MGKFKNLLLTRNVLLIFVAVIALNWTNSAMSGDKKPPRSGGAKVVTLMQDESMLIGGSIDVGPIDVSGFRFITILATHDGPFEPVTGSFVFSTEKGKSTDNIPRARFDCNWGGGPGGGVVQCFAAINPSTVRIGGPFFAGRVRNDTTENVVVTLKVYLSN